jgi:hypothetical protein
MAIEQLHKHGGNRLDRNDGRFSATKVGEELSSARTKVERGFAFAQGQLTAQPSIQR